MTTNSASNIQTNSKANDKTSLTCSMKSGVASMIQIKQANHDYLPSPAHRHTNKDFVARLQAIEHLLVHPAGFASLTLFHIYLCVNIEYSVDKCLSISQGKLFILYLEKVLQTLWLAHLVFKQM